MNGSLSNKNISQIFPGLWLKENPPKEYIKIKEKTSWSCHHGVSRWSTGCDCTPHSEWKNSLRKFIDRVSEIVNEVYQTEMSRYTADIWELRHRFIDVILDRKPKVTYIREVIDAELDGVDELKLDNLLSAQYERQRMYTSCGWFFEDFDRIEPQNVIAYAAQAIYWTQQVSGKDYLPELLPLLRDVHSHNNNLNGEDVFRRFFERSSIMVQDT
jgi:hypothetical protein